MRAQAAGRGGNIRESIEEREKVGVDEKETKPNIRSWIARFSCVLKDQESVFEREVNHRMFKACSRPRQRRGNK